MPATYSQPDRSMREALVAALRHHPRLEAAKVSITVLAAHGPVDKHGQLAGPAITIRGTAALAMVRIVSLRDRVAGLGDDA